MTLQEYVDKLCKEYEVLKVINLDVWHSINISQKDIWLEKELTQVYQPRYENNQKIIFTLTKGDVYDSKNANVGLLLQSFQKKLCEIDISNFFVILLTNDCTMVDAYNKNYLTISKDPVPINIVLCESQISEKQIKNKMAANRSVNAYNSIIPIKAEWSSLTAKEKHLLTKSPTFCMYPWIHFHAYPTGTAHLCCSADMNHSIGDMKKNTIKEIWNQDPIKTARTQMLNDMPVSACVRCYEQEQSGFMSLRQSANKHFGHYINRVSETQPDGTFERFELTYWDIRFSNLCNLSCRSCGHIFSSSWYQDQVKLAGPEWAANNKVLNYAGRFETDAWDQLVEHIDYVEQIYFAGGEPLLMEEHYRILDELVKRKKFDVKLIYNTNFTHTDLKGKSVFEYWKLFDSVSIGASLDAMGERAEYIRKGTVWPVVEKNRRDMLDICPQVDFYISPTLSIMNALHLPDFHKEWVEMGLIKPQDLNVNILQDPPYYRIDIATPEYKQQIVKKFQAHIEWLKDKDPLQRATVGYASAINFINMTDNMHLIDTFWKKTEKLDKIRNENILDVIPELEALK